MKDRRPVCFLFLLLLTACGGTPFALQAFRDAGGGSDGMPGPEPVPDEPNANDGGDHDSGADANLLLARADGGSKESSAPDADAKDAAGLDAASTDAGPTNEYTIGGYMSGLNVADAITLQNNGANRYLSCPPA